MFSMAVLGGLLKLAGLRSALAFALCVSLLSVSGFSSQAQAETRSLKLYYLHTGERATITYKKNGKYLASGLKKMNRFLRDWRRNEPTKMDPKLLDLVWEIYKESRSRKPIHVISAYRSLKTNNLLRKRGRGVAKKSQHTLGRAMDFFLPDVKLSKLRRIALKKQRGGVGFYPRSGSPFVHVDTGRVRHWPKMSRKQLARIFPRGRTLHIPSDGKPLSGYKIAQARYKSDQRKQGKIQIARGGFFSRDDDGDAEQNTTPGPRKVKTVAANPVNKPKIIPAGKNGVPVPRDTPRNQPVVAERPKQAPQTKPMQAPVPIAPVEPPKEIEVAALPPKETAPARIPVPVLAPRRSVVAQNALPVDALDGESLDNPAADPGTKLAFAPPVPQTRPDIGRLIDPSAAIASLEADKPAVPATKPATDVFALRAETNKQTDTMTRLTALSPTEIEILRRTALQNAIQSANPSVNPAKQPAARESQVASLITIDNAAIKKSARIAIPSAKPVVKKSAEVEVASLAPAKPAPQPKIVAEIEKPKAPKPAATAKLEKEVKQAARKIASRGRSSIDEFDMVDLDETVSGRWSLKADATIAEIADIRPPAYGRNGIRTLPSVVLTEGFSQHIRTENAYQFTGSSVEFLEVAKFGDPSKTAKK